MSPLPITYVTGSSHSGSTLLALLANEHPHVVSVGETAVKSRIRREGRSATQQCSCGRTIAECEFWRRIFEDMTSTGILFDADHWSTDYRFEGRWMDALLTRETSSFAVRKVRRWATRRVPLLSHRMARVDRANVEFVRTVTERSGASVFLDATKLLTRLTYLLDVPAFQVNVVRLVRDPRGVAASAKRIGKPVREAASVWLNDQRAIERLLSDRPTLSQHLIRYEDLCSNPSAVLGGLWRFCGVDAFDVPAVITPRKHHVLGNSMRFGDTVQVRLDERWKTALTRQEEDAVWAIAGPASEGLGYVR